VHAPWQWKWKWFKKWFVPGDEKNTWWLKSWAKKVEAHCALQIGFTHPCWKRKFQKTISLKTFKQLLLNTQSNSYFGMHFGSRYV
jgi:hypothetical protein